MLTEMFVSPAALALAARVVGLVVPMENLTPVIITTVIFTILGLLFFALAFFVITKATPFSVRKEIEEDHNTALAIVIGAIILGIAMIIAAAIQGG